MMTDLYLWLSSDSKLLLLVFYLQDKGTNRREAEHSWYYKNSDCLLQRTSTKYDNHEI